jgi:hypothetical protein
MDNGSYTIEQEIIMALSPLERKLTVGCTIRFSDGWAIEDCTGEYVTPPFSSIYGLVEHLNEVERGILWKEA